MGQQVHRAIGQIIHIKNIGNTTLLHDDKPHKGQQK
jgi:hypothetical protein